MIPPPLIEAADVAVVGAGAAGLYTALVAAASGARVVLVSSSPLAQSASYWAQGGLAAALDPDDTVDLHLADTVAAGRGATNLHMAEILCAEAPERVRELERLGISFDRSAGGELLLSLEGGHTRRRVAHAGGSATGRHVTARLSELVTAEDRIEVYERTSANALWVEDGRCVGVVTESAAIPAAATVLATGGAAALWERTTNPRGAIGSGMTLAHDAGAALADLEFMQFHPTAVAVPGELDGFLVTEAVRGDGALLRERRWRALRGRAGAPGRGHARHAEPDERGTARVPRPAPGRHAGVPQHRRAARRRRNRSGAGPRAGRARGALHDRRCGHGRARTLDVGRPLRGRRMRVHRRARSQPARLEFALGVLRLRQARSAVRGRGGRAHPERPTARRRPAGPAGRGNSRGPVARRGSRTETRPASSAWRPTRTRSPG